MKSVLTALLVIFLAQSINAQHINSEKPKHEIHEFKHLRISGMLYHTYIGTKTSEGMDLLIVPALGLDLEYWFNEKWGVGLHNDLELVNSEVWEANELHLHRETPLLVTVDALWNPHKGWVFLMGPGMEFEEHHKLFVMRAGVEYEIELNHHFDVTPTVFYDLREDAYDTFSFGIGIGKRF